MDSSQSKTDFSFPTEEQQIPLKLSDDLIGQIARLVQLAMITGTSVIDQFRGIRVAASGDTGEVTLHKDYVEGFETYLGSLLEQAEALAEEFVQRKEAEATNASES